MAKKKISNKTYILGMFPYPSGEGLHVGHVRIFTACDVMARYFRLKAKMPQASPDGSHAGGQASYSTQVLSPMGWDAFGLPAENAAIKAKKIPQTMVPHNYANFKAQMQALSLSFDWEHEFATTDPTYYAFTQWLFLKLYEKGLVYRERVPINWCPKCKTGIANEEVLGDGTHERCGTATGKKLLPQWVMRITEYAERLLTDLDHAECPPMTNKQMCTNGTHKTLDWPKGILEMQRNWIGKKEGINIEYRISNIANREDKITVFTTTPVNFGATFMVIAPEHEVVKKIVGGEYKVDEEVKNKVVEYVTLAQQKSEVDRMVEGKEKTGVFTGLYVKNHVTGEEIPVWVADFVLAHVGTGAVQGCPAHDKRDFEFAKKFGIPIKRVVVGEDGDESPVERVEQLVEKGMKGTMINSDFLNGMEFADAMTKTKDYFEEKGWGRRTTSYHLRDWVFSRQRYWGEPIPLVYCEKCGDENGVVPLTEDQLPLTLPELDSYEPTDTGESPLSRVEDWVNTTCPKCGGSARRETDTMPNWAGSCWYFLAYPWWVSDNQNTQKVRESEKPDNQKSTGEVLNEYKQKSKTPISDFWREVAKPAIDQWLPADWYLGGAEHAVLHLLYARFWVKVLQDLKLLDFPEPFLRLRSVGMVLAEDGKKMSKSLGNVVNPDDMVKTYGSDATRMYEMFMGPWEQSIAWDSGAISGQVRFLERVKATMQKEGKVGENTSPVLAAKLKALVERVEDGVLNQKFNTAIAGLMEFVNAWREEGNTLSKDHLGMVARLLSLFAPKTAQEIWEKVGKGSVEEQAWPDVSAISGVDTVMAKIAVQVNGKVRAILEVKGESAKVKEEVVELALADERVKKWVIGEVKKTVFVPGKLISFVA